MNKFIDDNRVVKVRCGLNFSYVLQDSLLFYEPHFKMLQSQTEIGFVKCVKIKHNGKLSFLYLVDELKSLDVIVKTIDSKLFLMLVASLFDEIIKLKKSEFFLFQNINTEHNSIFIDVDSLKVKLIYLPIRNDIRDDYFNFEKNVKMGLVKLIDELQFSDDEYVKQLKIDLLENMYSLEIVHNRLLDMIKKLEDGALKSNDDNGSKLKIISIDAPQKIEMNITKNDFVIGKNILVVDGAITFNRAISRIHCKVVKKSGSFFLVDLGSSNGTYLNNAKLAPNELHLLNDGDIIRLANSSFEVKIN